MTLAVSVHARAFALLAPIVAAAAVETGADAATGASSK